MSTLRRLFTHCRRPPLAIALKCLCSIHWIGSVKNQPGFWHDPESSRRHSLYDDLLPQGDWKSRRLQRCRALICPPAISSSMDIYHQLVGFVLASERTGNVPPEGIPYTSTRPTRLMLRPGMMMRYLIATFRPSREVAARFSHRAGRSGGAIPMKNGSWW